MYSWCTYAVLGMDLNSIYEALGFLNKSIFLNRIRLNFHLSPFPNYENVYYIAFLFYFVTFNLPLNPR